MSVHGLVLIYNHFWGLGRGLDLFGYAYMCFLLVVLVCHMCALVPKSRVGASGIGSRLSRRGWGVGLGYPGVVGICISLSLSLSLSIYMNCRFLGWAPSLCVVLCIMCFVYVVSVSLVGPLV